MTLWLTDDEAANRLLERDPLALLVGMALDQQIPMEKAFRGPQTLLERLTAPDPTAATSETRSDQRVCEA